MRKTAAGIAAITTCLFLAGAAIADPAPRLMSFEDMLNMENVGNAEFSPDGKWVEITRTLATTAHPSWGYWNAVLVRSSVVVVDRNGKSTHEIANTADVCYGPVFTHPWSPDSRGMVLSASRRNGYSFAYYDLASRRITPMAGRPIYLQMQWLQDGRVVYPSIADGVRQREISSTLLSNIEKRWQAEWTADVPQVTVSSSNGVFPSEPKPVGTLMLFDPRTRTSKVIAHGDFMDIATAKDNRHIAAISQDEDLASASSRNGRRSAIQIFELDGGSAHLLYSDPDIDAAPQNAMSWSPSGQKLIFEGRPVRDAQGHAIDYGRDLMAGMVLYEYDVNDGKLRLLSGAGVSQGNPDINDSNVLPIGWMGERPVAIGAHTVEGAVSALSNMPGVRTQLDYGGMRNTRFDLYVYDSAQAENLTTFAKASVQQFVPGQDFAYVVADGALWKVAPGKQAERVSPADAPPIAAFAVDVRNPTPPASIAYYHSGATERVSLMTLSGHTVGRSVLDLSSRKLIPAPAPTSILATAPDQLATVTKTTDGWSTSVTLNDGASKTLMTINAKLKDRAIAPAETFTYSYNGKTLTGWLVLPPGTKPGAKLPAIVSVYGGAVYGDQPPAFVRTDMYNPLFSGQLLAQQGYAVIYPSTPLGPGSDTNLMATLADETVAAVDALAAKGTVDPARVGVTGQSFGGFSTAAILSERSDRFKAGVAMAGVYDWMHGYGLRSMNDMFDDDDNMAAQETLLIESGQSRLGKPFWEAPDAYMRNSPIFRADKIDAPLLLLHGDLDLAVTGLTGAERLYNAMLRAGKHPALVHYWGEGHVAEGVGAMRDQWMRITTWFGLYVKGEKAMAH